MQISAYIDRFRAPSPKAGGTDFRSKVKPNSTIYNVTDGGFTIDGYRVRWANWDLHLAFDDRAAIVISKASIFDAKMKKFRCVLHRVHVSKTFFPCMDPTRNGILGLLWT